MNPDIRQQLMALTGVTDEEEFERMVANLASAASASGAEVAEGQSNGATETANVVRVQRPAAMSILVSCSPQSGERTRLLFARAVF